MFEFLKSKPPNPVAIASAILKLAQQPSLLEKCHQDFGLSPKYRERISFSILLFGFCCAHSWAGTKKNPRILDAWTQAVKLLPNCVRDPDGIVRVGDYLISLHEVLQALPILENTFQQRIPIPGGVTDSSLESVMYSTVANHQIQFATVIKVAILLRDKAYLQDIARAAHHSIHFKDLDVTFMCLAYSFYEQVTGTTLRDVSHDPSLVTNREMRCMNGTMTLRNYVNSVFANLSAL